MSTTMRERVKAHQGALRLLGSVSTDLRAVLDKARSNQGRMNGTDRELYEHLNNLSYLLGWWLGIDAMRAGSGAPGGAAPR